MTVTQKKRHFLFYSPYFWAYVGNEVRFKSEEKKSVTFFFIMLEINLDAFSISKLILLLAKKEKFSPKRKKKNSPSPSLYADSIKEMMS